MPLQAEPLLAIKKSADEQADADDAIAHHDDHREDHLADERRTSVSGQHDRQNEYDLDHGDGHCQHQGAIGLAGTVRDYVGMMD